MSEATGGYMVSRPTLATRFWCKLGYRYHHGEDPKWPFDTPPGGWQRTDVNFHFGVLDRLRLLLTGRMRVSVVSDTDTPSPSTITTRTDWHIRYPGERCD